MKRTIAIAAAAAAALLLGACGEKPQEVSQKRPGTTVTRDTRPWDGDRLAFEESTFKRGDKASWENALKTRQQGQNEYTRTGAAR